MLIILTILLLLLIIWSVVGIRILKHTITTKPYPTNNFKFLIIFVLCGPIAWMLFIICFIIDFLSNEDYP